MCTSVLLAGVIFRSGGFAHDFSASASAGLGGSGDQLADMNDLLDPTLAPDGDAPSSVIGRRVSRDREHGELGAHGRNF